MSDAVDVVRIPVRSNTGQQRRQPPPAMYVVKRNGDREDMKFDKITTRIHNLCGSLGSSNTVLDAIDPALIAQKVVAGLFSGVTTTQLDELAAETAVFMSTTHPQYGTLAARIAVSNLHKTTVEKFSQCAKMMAEHVHAPTGAHCPLLDPGMSSYIAEHATELDDMIQCNRDFDLDYFGFKTLEKTYLIRIANKVVERPQYLFARVAVALHWPNLDAIRETYFLLSRMYLIHATPTLFNAGSLRPQMSSCYLVGMQEDSIEGIFETLKSCAIISKYAGGIGLSVHNVRSTGSYIAGTHGTSNGLIPMLKVFSDMAKYVDQGGGKRKGSVAIYIEPWHPDILGVIALRKNHGAEESRARDLFPALWVCDLFMHRVQAEGTWSLFCPHEAPGLQETWGDAFNALYETYEREGKARHTMPARDLWFAILQSQIETGTPYLLYKDACNRKSNQQHLGTIQCSNLCTEIVQYTSRNEIAVCNLASISLPAFLIDVVDGDGDVDDPSTSKKKTFDWDTFGKVVRVAVRNLNQVIDRTFYPVKAAHTSNRAHRPVGLGVQGLADVFAMLHLPYESEEAAALNRDIFESMYFHALSASCELAKEQGTYDSYAGSPISRNILQPDMWPGESIDASTRHDWPSLRANIKAHGVRNSLLVAPMPTASTAQILGNNEAFEPFTSNLYSRRTLAGEFVVLNKHMTAELLARGLWTEDMRTSIVAHRGSVQNIPEFPKDLKPLFKTVWEMKMKSIIDLARGRAPFIDQSQSLNLFVADPTEKRLTSMHFHAWSQGLKTGMYYLRTRPKADPIQFTVDPRRQVAAASVASAGTSTTIKSGRQSLLSTTIPADNDDDEDDVPCTMCSS